MLHGDDSRDAGEVRAWRKARREELLAWRSAVPPTQRDLATAAIAERLLREVPRMLEESVAFYLPMRAEVDLLPLLERVNRRGRASLPVITDRTAHLAFRTWQRGERLQEGPFQTLQPVHGEQVHPGIILLPLVGFDRGCFRLGYGGGFYDRTLAALDPRPMTIGIGFAGSELKTIYPQPYDVALDCIVTEQETIQRAR